MSLSAGTAPCSVRVAAPGGPRCTQQPRQTPLPEEARRKNASRQPHKALAGVKPRPQDGGVRGWGACPLPQSPGAAGATCGPERASADGLRSMCPLWRRLHRRPQCRAIHFQVGPGAPTSVHRGFPRRAPEATQATGPAASDMPGTPCRGFAVNSRGTWDSPAQLLRPVKEGLVCVVPTVPSSMKMMLCFKRP